MKRRLLAFTIVLAMAGVGFIGFGINNQNSDQKFTPRVEASQETPDGLLEIRKRLYGDEDGNIDFTAIKKAYLDHKKSHSSRVPSIGMQWESLGPNNVGGRTLAMIIDKDDSEILVAGSVTGGVWRSTTGGNRWTQVADVDWSFISCAAQAPNGDMYFGTGGRIGGWPGNGIYKSTDRGLTWKVLENTQPNDNVNNGNNPWSYVNKIEVDPNNSQRVYAATGTGFYYSTDGGVNWTKPNFSPPAVNGNNCQDLAWSGDGARLNVAYSGTLVYSDNPTDGTSFKNATVNNNAGGAYARVATSAADPNKVYYARSTTAFSGIWVSDDKGETYDPIDPAPPLNDANWDLDGTGGTGTGGIMWYSFDMSLDPSDADRMFIGSLQMWRFDGNWTRATHEFGGPGNSFDEFYIHADKQGYFWDPNDSKTLYVTHDGGISKSVDGGITFFEVVRDYVTTEFYGIAMDAAYHVIGGTQDNGNLGLDPTGEFSGGNPDFGLYIRNQGILNGDGFDVEISNIVDMKFTTAQNGNLGRSKIASGTGSGMCGSYCGSGPFWSVHRLWENIDDPLSQDSIVFEADTFRQGVGIGSGATKTFTGTLAHAQPAADVVYNSVFFSVGTQVLEDWDGDGVLTGDGTGTVNSSTGEFTVNWTVAPSLNTPVYAYYAVTFEAGDVIVLQSLTDEIPFYHELTTNINVGDKIMVRDPVQSTMVSAIGAGSAPGVNSGGIIFARSVLNLAQEVEWMEITKDIPNFPSGWDGSNPTCFEYSPNGGHLYVGTNQGDVWRVSKLHQLYEKNVMAQGVVQQSLINNLLDFTKIYDGPGSRSVTGISLSPHDKEVLVVTHGGWVGSSATNSWTYLIDNAQSSTGTSNSNITNIRGDLPPMPVFDAEIDVMDPNVVLIGTAFGVYGTKDVFAAGGNVNWTEENGGFTLPPPVYDIRQQRLDGKLALNHEMYYIGTHGNGILASTTLTSTPELEHLTFNGGVSELTIFPNPVMEQANVKVSVDQDAMAELMVIDLTGKVVVTQPNHQLIRGENILEINTSTLSPGVYMSVLKVGSEKQVTRFIKQ